MIVQPQGDPASQLVILGEAPGEEDAHAGQPFIGPSGRLLFDQILARAGIRRTSTLVLYTHWEMPPGKKWETIPEDELGKYDEHTATVLLSHSRKLILAIGEHALDFCMKGTARVVEADQLPVAKWRGSILETQFGTVIPMIHPAKVMQSGGYSEDADEDDKANRKGLHYKALCIHDAKRAKQFMDGVIGLPPKRQVLHAGNSSYEEMHEFLRGLILSTDPIAFDIETYAHTITCLGVAGSMDAAAVIPFTFDEQSNWSIAERSQLIEQVIRVLDSENPKIGQHLDYDVQHLAKFGIPVRNVWLDTAVAHSILWPEMPHDLATLTSLYTLQPYFKDMREDSKEADMGDPIQRWEYNGLDCCVTWECGMKLDSELKTRIRGKAA